MFLNTQSAPKASKFPPMHELVRQNQVHPQQVQQRYVGFEGVCIPSCLGQHKGHWTQNNSFQRSLENPEGFVGVWVCFKFPSSQSNWERWQLHCFFFINSGPEFRCPAVTTEQFACGHRRQGRWCICCRATNDVCGPLHRLLHTSTSLGCDPLE